MVLKHQESKRKKEITANLKVSAGLRRTNRMKAKLGTRAKDIKLKTPTSLKTVKKKRKKVRKR